MRERVATHQNLEVERTGLTTGGLFQRKYLSIQCKPVKESFGTRINYDSDFSRLPLQAPFSGALTQLTVGQPNDKYEQEADRVAEAIIRPSVNETPDARIQKDSTRSHLKITKRYNNFDNTGPTLVAPVRDLTQGGRYLSSAERSYFEPRFGHSFERVRLHSDSKSNLLARTIGAEAFTIGTDVYFKAGVYLAGTESGKGLLAHELAHVIQQGNMLARVIQRSSLYSGGFNGYPSVSQEIDAIRLGVWQPTTPDFAATALGGGTPINSIGQFMGWISIQQPNSITQINLIGHSNPDDFAFSGSVVASTGAVMLNIGQGLTIPNLQAYASVIQQHNLRDRFAQNATITLYSCYTGVTQGLLQAIAHAFQVPARGFSSALHWCIRYTPQNTLEGRGEVTTGRCPGQVGLGHLNPNETVNP